MKWVSHLRAWLVGVIKEGVTPPAKPPAKSGHVQFMKFAAARSLLADGLSIEAAAVAVGVEPADLKAWLSPYARGELALAYEPLIAEKAKANQGARTDLRPILDKSFKPVDTHKKIAKAAKVDPATIAKVKLIAFANISEGNRHEARGRQDCKNVVR